jgi:hypothetical protein
MSDAYAGLSETPIPIVSVDFKSPFDWASVTFKS